MTALNRLTDGLEDYESCSRNRSWTKTAKNKKIAAHIIVHAINPFSSLNPISFLFFSKKSTFFSFPLQHKCDINGNSLVESDGGQVCTLSTGGTVFLTSVFLAFFLMTLNLRVLHVFLFFFSRPALKLWSNSFASSTPKNSAAFPPDGGLYAKCSRTAKMW